MTLTSSKRILGLIWIIGGLIPIVFLYIQDSYFEKYGDKGEEVWNWLLPTVVPTITLIIGVYAYDFYQTSETKKKDDETAKKTKKTDRQEKEESEKKSDRADNFIFYLTLLASLGYLLFVISILFLEPYSTDTIFEQISESRKFWGTLQLFVNPLVGIFFVAVGKK